LQGMCKECADALSLAAALVVARVTGKISVPFPN
jgi:hypothetical protein